MNQASSKEVEWLNPTEMRAWRALIKVGSGLFDAIEADLKRTCELTLEDYEVLHLLSQAPEHRIRIGQLVTEMLSGRTRLTQRIDRLANRGLLQKKACPTDARAINVVLTSKGHELLLTTAPLHLQSVRHWLFDQLDSAQVSALAQSLEKLVTQLETKDLKTETESE